VSMTRRQILALGGGLLACPPAVAFGEASLVDVAELALPDGTVSRPNAWKRLLYEVIQTTSVECSPRPVLISPDLPELFEHPFSVLVLDGPFAPLSDVGVEQLSRYLAYGGFLLIDDTTGAERGPLDASVRRLIGRLFPTRPLSPLPADHSVFRSFFLLDKPLGRLARHSWLEGVTVGNVTPLVYMRNDLSGALDRMDDGRPRQACVPGGEGQRREAIKLGINLILYSLTANYKRDQAHVRALMLNGRLE
jgi:hypothetical protein